MSTLRNHRLFDWRFLAPIAVIVMAILAWIVWSRLSAAPRVVFYGVVVDQDGRPVEGAQITASTAKLVTHGASVIRANSTAKKLSVQTDARGSFSITLPIDHDDLLIESVRKPGYDWVIDWAWTIGRPEKLADNRSFQFPGVLLGCAGYKPDADHPAIFPLHLQGSPKPVANPSRGGFEVGCDKHTVHKLPNQPVRPNIPSAGPGAPRTSEEIDAAIVVYSKTRQGLK